MIIFFHIKGMDYHLFFQNKKITIIPCENEIYIGIRLNAGVMTYIYLVF